jgi:hypothetical protein
VAALLALVFLTLSPAGMLAQTQQIPAHPRELKYAPLEYTPPKHEQYRHVLSNRAVAYLVEDHIAKDVDQGLSLNCAYRRQH